jgi:ankyrin repeat protein
MPNTVANKKLIEAAANNDIELLNEAILEGAEVNAVVDDTSALHEAADKGNKEVVTVLLEKGADPLIKAKDLLPLEKAAEKGNSEVIETLLELRAENGERKHKKEELEKGFKKSLLSGHINTAEKLFQVSAELNEDNAPALSLDWLKRPLKSGLTIDTFESSVSSLKNVVNALKTTPIENINIDTALLNELNEALHMCTRRINPILLVKNEHNQIFRKSLQ